MSAIGSSPMADAIQDGTGQGWVADGLVPVFDRQLAGDDGGSAAVAVFEDFEEVAALGGGEDGKAPIVDYQHIHAGDGLEDAFVAAPISRTGTAGKSEGFEHARGALIEDGPSVTARLVPKGAGDPAFAKAGRTGDQQVLMARNPAAIGKMRHDTAVKAARRAQVQIFDAGILTQGSEPEPRGQFLAVTFSSLAVDQQTETLFELEIVEVEGG